MAFDFPTSPTAGQVYQGYQWDGEKWRGGLPALTDAPNDGHQYARQAQLWARTDGPVKIASGITAASHLYFDVALPPGYQTLELNLAGVTTTGAGQLAARFSADGTTFPATNYIHGGNATVFPTAANSAYGSVAATEIILTGTMLSSDTNRGVVKLTIPVVTAPNQLQHMLVQSSYVVAANQYGVLNGMGVNPVAGQPAAIRLLMTAGATIATGMRWQLNGWR